MFYVAWRNITRRLGQSCVTGFIVALTVALITASFVCFTSIRRGVELSTERLGADIMVLPSQAASSASTVLFMSEPVNVYLPADEEQQVADVEGVARTTSQFFTQTLNQSCCSVTGITRVVGIDTESDFVLTPWSPSGDLTSLGPDQIILGSDAPDVGGDQVSILGKTFHVHAYLDETGTSVDETIFMDIDTARTIAADSEYLQGVWKDTDPYDSISCIMVDVRDGEDTDAVARSIGESCPGVSVVTTSTLVSDVSEQIGMFETVSAGLLIALGIIAILALAGRFTAMVRARRKELGLMRALGIGRGRVMLSVMLEVGIVTLMAGAVGAAAGLLVSGWLIGLLHDSFALPGGSPVAATYLAAFVMGIACSLFLSFLSLLQPSISIMRHDPQETIARGDL